MSEKKEIVKKSECIKYIEEQGLEWPVVFYVCKKHKKECFTDYDFALVSEEKPCEICSPRDNDSWGG
jgi:hypothetical protein